MINKFLLTLSLCLLVVISDAQEKVPTVKIDDCEFYIHKVEQGNTLYGISKKFNSTVEAITKANPSVAQGLKPGMEVKIPVVKENKKLHKLNTPEMQGSVLFHTVEKGQTLYAISKLYNVDLNDLIKENPGVESSLATGAIIKIPSTKVKAADPSTVLPALPPGFQFHKVKKGETIYSISKQYKISPDSLKAANKKFPEGLREGSMIIIPSSNAPVTVTETTDIHSVPLYLDRHIEGRPLKLTLLLPFQLDQNRQPVPLPAEKDFIHPSSLPAIMFYKGFMAALDSLKEESVSIEAVVYDVSKDSTEIASLVEAGSLSGSDMIIGPFFMSAFNQLGPFAEKNQVWMVSPFTQAPGITEDNPFALKVTPSDVTEMKTLARELQKRYPKENVLVFNNNNPGDRDILAAFITEARAVFDPRNLPKEISYTTLGFSGVQSALVTDRKNILVVPSTDQPWVTELVSRLHNINTSNIMLVAPEAWLSFENLDLNYLQKANAMFVSGGYVDFTSADVIRFAKEFRDRYAIDPDVYAVKGYDIANYLVRKLLQFDVTKEPVQATGLCTNFNFRRESLTGGWENHSVTLIKLEDFNLHRVK